MIRKTQYITSSLAIWFCVLVAYCDSSKDTSKTSQDKPKTSATVPTSSTNAQQLSADARSCLDLVKSMSYAEAIKPCQRAIQNTSNTEVSRAYEKAKVEVKKAAESAATDAAKDAASDALGGRSGN